MPHLRRTTVGLNDFLNFPRFLFPIITTNLLSSTAVISSYSSIQSSHLFHVENPKRSFVDLLKNISRNAASLAEVGTLHCRAVKNGSIHDGQVGNSLLNLYVKCAPLDLAHKLFDEMVVRDTLTWTLLISGYSRIGHHDIGVGLFVQMVNEGALPNRFTLSTALKCCVSLDDLKGGKQIHGWILRNGIQLDVLLQNSTLDLYSKCGEFGYAKRAFEMMTERDVVSWNIMIGAMLQIGDTHRSIELFKRSPFRDVSSWNTIITGHMRNGYDTMALQLIYDMVESGLCFNRFTFSIALVLAGSLALSKLGREIHAQVLRLGVEHDAFIRNSLIDMYCKCGRVEISVAIFDGVSHSKTQRLHMNDDELMQKCISWSSMVAGYVHNGRSEEALELFRRMFREGARVDGHTLTSIAAACADAGILEQGKQVHGCIEKLGHGFDVLTMSAITDMYAKCGSLEDAHKNFYSIKCRNVVSWTSIIGSYALYGQGWEAIRQFEMMLAEKIMPNGITFVGVLSACSHGGLVEEGYKYFNLMQEDYGIVPSIEHYTCMVDLFSRLGLLDRAKEFIDEHNISSQGVVWRALLSACRVHNNIKMAIFASKKLSQLEPYDAGSYILLSNTYATKQDWLEVSKLRKVMKDRGIRKKGGRSWIQLKNQIHTFLAGDRSHPQADDIYSYLEILIGRLKEMGYSSRTDSVLLDLEDEQKQTALNFHSEKLAIAYGIISTPYGSPLRIMKNLRVCVDCHEAIKYISQATEREVVVRDAHRFHHFKVGTCSCGDYW